MYKTESEREAAAVRTYYHTADKVIAGSCATNEEMRQARAAYDAVMAQPTEEDARADSGGEECRCEGCRKPLTSNDN